MNESGAEKSENRGACSQHMQRQSLIKFTLIARSQDKIRINGISSESRILRLLSGTEQSHELV